MLLTLFTSSPKSLLRRCSSLLALFLLALCLQPSLGLAQGEQAGTLPAPGVWTPVGLGSQAELKEEEPRIWRHLEGNGIEFHFSEQGPYLSYMKLGQPEPTFGYRLQGSTLYLWDTVSQQESWRELPLETAEGRLEILDLNQNELTIRLDFPGYSDQWPPIRLQRKF